MSFIEKAKRAGAQSLLGYFTHREGFDSKLKNLRIERLGDGEVECSLRVTPEVQNAYGTLHGGATCTLVDVVGTIAMLTKDVTKPGVSVELNVSFTSAATTDTEVTILGRVLKHGNRLAFTEVEIRSKSDNKLIAIGRHTKAV